MFKWFWTIFSLGAPELGEILLITQLHSCFTWWSKVESYFLPGPSRRLAPVIKCNAFLGIYLMPVCHIVAHHSISNSRIYPFLCFQSYIVRDISLTEIYRWLVTFGSVRWDLSLVQKFEVGSNNCNHVNINSISLHTEWFNATIFTAHQ